MRRYYIQHRYGDNRFVEILNERVHWTTLVDEATSFGTFEEAKEALLKYSDGNKYGWIGLEKGGWIGYFEFTQERFISEDTVDFKREAERNGTN